MPLNLPTDCDGCVKKFPVQHDLSCPKGILVLTRNDGAAKEWGALSARSLNPSDISYKPEIHSRTVQGESHGAGDQFLTGSQEREENKDGEGATGQATLPDESQAGVSIHDFLKWVTSALFDIQGVNFDADSYMCQASAKALATAEKEKKYK